MSQNSLISYINSLHFPVHLAYEDPTAGFFVRFRGSGWSIDCGNIQTSLSSLDFECYYESLNSSKDDEFFKEFRSPSLKDALCLLVKYIDFIIDLQNIIDLGQDVDPELAEKIIRSRRFRSQVVGVSELSMVKNNVEKVIGELPS